MLTILEASGGIRVGLAKALASFTQDEIRCVSRSSKATLAGNEAWRPADLINKAQVMQAVEGL